MKKIVIAALVLSSAVFANAKTLEDVVNECRVPYSVMYAVAQVESGWHKGGYPYVIGVNEDKDMELLRQNARRLNITFLAKKSIDCHDLSNCTQLAAILVENHITNIDLGLFQINYKWHAKQGDDMSLFFKIPESYERTCSAIEECVKRLGWGWKGIACYHSNTQWRNVEYANKLAKVISMNNYLYKRGEE